MNVLYICSPPFMDFSLEQVNDLKRRVKLHVWVYVSLRSPDHTIFRLKEKFSEGMIRTFDEIKDQLENADLFEHYFAGCQSVHFIFFSRKSGLNILFTSIRMLRLITSINPGVVHFDEITGRLLLFKHFIRKRKIIVNMHDPMPHSGENSLRLGFIRKFIFRNVDAICTFSNFSKGEIEKHFNIRIPVLTLRLVPYFAYDRLDSQAVDGINKSPAETVLLFFGRISPYKGIDELLLAFEKLLPEYPNLKLVIAGKGNYRYQVPIFLKNSASLVIIDRYIHENEIKSLFAQADVLICPYRDATQSGVIMTARALKLPVIASKVGALPEYVHDGKDGFIYDPHDNKGLEKAIVKFVKRKSGHTLPTHIPDYSDVQSNSRKLVSFYKDL